MDFAAIVIALWFLVFKYDDLVDALDRIADALDAIERQGRK